MKCLGRAAAISFLVAAVILGALAADQAKSFYKKGQDAEARQNYEQAYDFYKQAYDLKPTNLNYRASFERLRFLAGASHVHRGQLLREAGQLDTALAEFQKAFEIDPSSAIAKQELQRTKQMMDAAKAAPTAAAPPSGFLQKRIERGRRSGRTGRHLQCSHQSENHRGYQGHLRDGRQAGGNQRSF